MLGKRKNDNTNHADEGILVKGYAPSLIEVYKETHEPSEDRLIMQLTLLHLKLESEESGGDPLTDQYKKLFAAHEDPVQMKDTKHEFSKKPAAKRFRK